MVGKWLRSQCLQAFLQCLSSFILTDYVVLNQSWWVLMPNRIIREGILSSERVFALSVGAEVFYRRLLNVVDDFGRFHASPITLRAACWPTHPDRISDRDVGRWMLECAEGDTTALIRVYSVGGCNYIEVTNFGQVIRAKKSKFPAPAEGSYISSEELAQHMLCTCAANDVGVHSTCAANDVLRRYSETESKTDADGGGEHESQTSSKVRSIEGEKPHTQPKTIPVIDVVFEQLYTAHPLKGWKYRGAYALASLLESAVNPDSVIRSVVESHARWCQYWADNGDRRVGFEMWINEGLYLEDPIANAKARDSPKKPLSAADDMGPYKYVPVPKSAS